VAGWVNNFDYVVSTSVLISKQHSGLLLTAKCERHTIFEIDESMCIYLIVVVGQLGLFFLVFTCFALRRAFRVSVKAVSRCVDVVAVVVAVAVWLLNVAWLCLRISLLWGWLDTRNRTIAARCCHFWQLV
jgi:nitrate reductase gamma subunit